MAFSSSRLVAAKPGSASWFEASRPSCRIDPESRSFTLLLGLLAALPALSIDISQPTLLSAARQFLVSPGLLGWTITLFMAGFAAGQLAAGPMSDRHGRRPVLLCGLAGYSLAALWCALAGSVEALIGFRLLQGLAAGACANLAFAMIRDVFDERAARAKRAYVTAIFALAPILAPIAGAWILAAAGWRMVYLVLACAGLALLAVSCARVAETRPVAAGDVPRRTSIAAYRWVLSQPRFSTLAAVNACSYGAVFAYIAGSPQVLMARYGLSAYGYGLAFAAIAAALTAGAVVSGRAANAGLASHRLVGGGLFLAACSAAAMVLLNAGGMLTMPMLLGLLAVHLFCRGLVGPTIQHLALEPMREQAGAATAAIGVTQILHGAVCSAAVVLLLSSFGAMSMTLVMAASSLAAFALWRVNPARRT